MSDTDVSNDVSALTVQLLSAYLANNTVPSEQLAELIKTTRAALTEEASSNGDVAEAEQFTPAVSVRKSLASPEHILSLIDGRPYKTLKRHLASRGLTPAEYRERYKLPANYPMVAPAYADHRRAVAHNLGLGRKGRKLEGGNTSAPSDVAEGAPSPEAEIETPQNGAVASVDGAAESGTGDKAGQAKAGAKTSARGTKRAAGEKARPAKSGKAAAKASADSAETIAQEPAAAQDSADGKPTRRRGKIGLFKAKAAEPAGEADKKADDASAPQADEGQDSKAESAASAKRKPARTARKAREPQASAD